MAVDLKTQGGREILWRLAETADVLVENMRPPVKERLGFDYDTIHICNPRLVYGSISGFGQDGPYRERGGIDQVAQGMGGLMSVTGMPGTEPTRVGIPISDLAAGLYLAVGILVALHDRERTGEGRWVQTSLLESMIGMMDFQATRWTVDGDIPIQEGNHHPTLVPMGCFRTADGVINVAGSGGRLLENFLSAVGLAELIGDPRFDTTPKRSANRTELNARIAERLQTRTTADWIEAFNAVGVPCGPVYRLDEVFADPQVQHLRLVSEVQHRVLGTQAIVRNPVTIIGAGPTVRRPAPDIGEHTSEVLSELGLSEHDLHDLRRQGVPPGLRMMDTGTDKLLVDVGDGIARVTFNNPERLNALSIEMRAALPNVLATLNDDPDVRVLVITGAGGKAFVSGADISEFGEHRTSPEARAAYDRAGAATQKAWRDVGKPIIAKIQGYCIGGGLLTAMAADIRIASDDSQFGVPAARLGLGYAFAGVAQLMDLVGPGWAAEILFSARRLDATQARDIGLINRFVPASRLEDEVMELARAIGSNAPLTIAAVKAALREARRDPAERDLARVAALVEACFRSTDYLEGQQAFAEKRSPKFSGR